MLSQQLSDGNNPCVKIILILAANPKSTSRLRLDEEVREIDEGLRRASKREQFRLEQKWAVRQRDFYRAILDYQPQIVHFSGHGTGIDGIVLEDETEQLVQVNASALASMFKLFATKGVECVLLNACYSEVQAKAISQHVNYVIGMNKTVGDKAAIAFSVAFYDALASGEEMEFAYELGCSILINYLEQQTPVLLKKDQISIIPIQPEVDIIPPNPYQGPEFLLKNSIYIVNTIQKLISVIAQLLQIKKYRYERLKVIYTQLLEPIFNELSLVHNDYLEMFNYAHNKTPFNWEFRLPTYQEKTRYVIDYLQEKRREFEPVRSKLRVMIDELKDVEINTEADDFIRAVIQYFPEGNIISENNSHKDSNNYEYKSSSAHILDRLTEAIVNENKTDSTEKEIEEFDLKDIILKTIDYHQKAWQDVCRAFIRLKIRVTVKE